MSLPFRAVPRFRGCTSPAPAPTGVSVPVVPAQPVETVVYCAPPSSTSTSSNVRSPSRPRSLLTAGAASSPASRVTTDAGLHPTRHATVTFRRARSTVRSTTDAAAAPSIGAAPSSRPIASCAMRAASRSPAASAPDMPAASCAKRNARGLAHAVTPTAAPSVERRKRPLKRQRLRQRPSTASTHPHDSPVDPLVDSRSARYPPSLNPLIVVRIHAPEQVS
jgi:hypothetical protein